MLRAEELRVGNYIYNEVQKINFQVNSVVIHRICFGDNENYKPVKLSEEILLKCGFRLKVDEYGKTIAATSNGVKLVAIGNHKQFVFYYQHNSRTIQYLHQLQNLYFALTGRELNVNF